MKEYRNDIEKIIKKNKNTKEYKNFKISYDKYKTLKDACKAYNIDYHTIICWKKRYKTSGAEALYFKLNEKSYNLDPPGKKTKCIDRDGTIYNSKAEICKIYNINPTTVSSKAKALKISFIDALHYYNDDNMIIDKNGLKYKSISELCKAHNISPTIVYTRMYHYKCSAVDAIYLKLKRQYTKPIKIKDINNIEYNSAKELFEKNNITESHRVYFENKHNMTTLEAFYYIKDIKENFIFDNIKMIKHKKRSSYWLVEINGIQSFISCKALASKYLAYLIEKEKEKNMK